MITWLLWFIISFSILGRDLQQKHLLSFHYFLAVFDYLIIFVLNGLIFLQT